MSRKNLSQPQRSAEGQKTRKAPARRRGWPILEIVAVLLLVKIAAGGWYLLSGPGSGSAADEGQAALSLPDLSLIESAVAELSGRRPSGEENKVNEYLAAAAEAVSPASAQAAGGLSLAAAMPANAMAAGAMMVLGAQAADSGAVVDSIPLPPGGEDLTVPAAHLPPPPLPQVGSNRAPAPEAAAGQAAPAASSERASAPVPAPSSSSSSSSSAAELRSREQALARREALLSTREEALSSLEEELNQRLAALEASRGEIETMTRRNEATLEEMKALREEQEKEKQQLEDARIQHLVTAYKGMKPDQAGLLINSMDDDVAVAILSAMPGRNAGLILANVEPGKAARLTKAISERRLDPNLILGDQAAENPPVQ